MPRKGYRKCSIENCHGNEIAKGLCDIHYRRQLHHGHLENTRPNDWGSRERHPLHGPWIWMRRSRKPIEESWKDFWRFVSDVGSPPDEHHKLYRKDESLPYG